jgi:hypothetical protein
MNLDQQQGDDDGGQRNAIDDAGGRNGVLYGLVGKANGHVPEFAPVDGDEERHRAKLDHDRKGFPIVLVKALSKPFGRRGRCADEDTGVGLP